MGTLIFQSSSIDYIISNNKVQGTYVPSLTRVDECANVKPILHYRPYSLPRLTVWLIDRLADLLSDWLADWFVDWFIIRCFKKKIGWLMGIEQYNVRTLLKDEHVQELEDELKENNMKWDVIGLGEVRRKEESFTTLQSGHLLYHSEANNGQSGVGFLINKKWKDNITRVSSGSSRVAELIIRITDRYQLKIVQVYMRQRHLTQTKITHKFYNTIDKILEKQTHYTIVMGDLNAKVGGQTNKSERATGCFGLGQRNERVDTLVELATSKNFKIMNTQFQKKAGRRWTWRSPYGSTKTKLTT